VLDEVDAVIPRPKGRCQLARAGGDEEERLTWRLAQREAARAKVERCGHGESVQV